MALLEVDADQCVGSAHCVFTAPDLFELDEEGRSVVRQPEPDADHHEAAEAAVRGCPASAIRFARG